MDEQGGAGGVPPHDGHGSHVPGGAPRDDEQTAAADTDEASRLDRPGPAPDPSTGRRRWVSPRDDGGIWDYGEDVGHQKGIDLIGYKVEATDGSIGKIDKHSEGVGASYLVVDTGGWIFGRHVLLPAGTIQRIDTVEEKVYVNRSKEQIKNAPEFDEAKYSGEPSYLEQFARYHGQPHM